MPVIQAGLEGLVADNFRSAAASHNSGLELVAVAAARPQYVGHRLEEAVPHCSPRWRDVPVVSLDNALEISAPVVFSGLRNEDAAEYEDKLAASRTLVTNSSVNRMRDDVALFNAYVGGTQLEQLYGAERPGYILAVGNCMTIIESVVLAPLAKEIGITAVRAKTFQGWSGAGLRAIPNDKSPIGVIPGDEREKQTTELNKFFGAMDQPANMRLSARPNRGPWVLGHYAKLEVTFQRLSSQEEVESLWHDFKAPDVLRSLHYGNKYRPRSHPVRVSRRQSLLQLGQYGAVGIVRPEPMRVKALFSGAEKLGRQLSMEVVGDNLMLGAAGSAVMNIAYARRKGHIKE